MRFNRILGRLSPSRLGRGALGAAIVVAGILAASPEAFGVIEYTATGPVVSRNTTAPTDSSLLALWNNEVEVGAYLGTPIDSTHFIAAQHIGAYSTYSKFNGTTWSTYNIVGYADDPGTDLRIYQIAPGETLTPAPLYTGAAGSEIGKTMTVFGRGTQPGTAYGSVGWLWGSSDSAMSWGQNVVSGVYTSGVGPFVGFAFGSTVGNGSNVGNGITSAAGLSDGDSSGPVFVQNDGLWELAGINYGVDSWSTTAGGAQFNANLFDTRGLYTNGSTTPTTGTYAVPGNSYASEIAPAMTWNDGVSSVPEPGTLALCGAGLSMFVVWGWRRRRPLK